MKENVYTIDCSDIKLYRTEKRLIYQVFRRIVDLVFSILLLTITSPLIFIFGIAVVLESKGPAFYTQERVGKMGKIFKLYKIRSMREDAEKDGIKWTAENDDRITKVEKIIRKVRIDELPQFFNILKGDMSLIGPRPERVFFYEELEKSIPGFKDRLQVKPGLTGLAQVNGGYDITSAEKLDLDLHYIKNRNIKMDIIIVLKTIKVVLTGEGAR